MDVVGGRTKSTMVVRQRRRLRQRRDCGIVMYGTVRYGTVRYGTVRYGTVWYGIVPHGEHAIGQPDASGAATPTPCVWQPAPSPGGASDVAEHCCRHGPVRGVVVTLYSSRAKHDKDTIRDCDVQPVRGRGLRGRGRWIPHGRAPGLVWPALARRGQPAKDGGLRRVCVLSERAMQSIPVERGWPTTGRPVRLALVSGL